MIVEPVRVDPVMVEKSVIFVLSEDTYMVEPVRLDPVIVEN